MSDTDEGPVVGVFRLQLFKPSETFITGQAGALKHYRPVHIGRRLHGPAPAGAEVVVAPSGCGACGSPCWPIPAPWPRPSVSDGWT